MVSPRSSPMVGGNINRHHHHLEYGASSITRIRVVVVVVSSFNTMPIVVKMWSRSTLLGMLTSPRVPLFRYGHYQAADTIQLLGYQESYINPFSECIILSFLRFNILKCLNLWMCRTRFQLWQTLNILAEHSFRSYSRVYTTLSVRMVVCSWEGLL